MGNALSAIITIVFILVGIGQVLAPVFKAIAEANEKSKRKAMQDQGGVQDRNRNDRGAFLPEMTQQGVPRPAAAVSQPANSSRSARNKPNPSKKQKQQGSTKGQTSAKTATGNRSPGSGVGAHVDSYIGQHVKSHIGQQLNESVKHDIADQVRSHLGEDKNKPSAPSAATTHGSAAAGSLLLALRSPEGVRQAILMNEVLSKPKSLRRS